MGWRLRTSVTGQLDAAEVAAVQDLVSAAAAHDGFTSLNEAGLRGINIGKRFHVEQGRFTEMV